MGIFFVFDDELCGETSVQTDMALTTDRQKCAHLLRRFGLGASEAELDFYLSKGGIDGAIDTLLNYEGTPEGWDLDVEAMANKNNNNVNPQAVGVWWAGRMLVTARPLQETGGTLVYMRDFVEALSQRLLGDAHRGTRLDEHVCIGEATRGDGDCHDCGMPLCVCEGRRGRG